MTGEATRRIGGRALGRRTVALFLLSLIVTAAAAQEHRGGPPEADRGEVASSLYTAEDLLFLSHMIVHHEQALDLAALVPSRTRREEFVRFARYVDEAQRTEIDQMRALLRVATERGMEIPHHDMSGDPPMAGMLSKAQMAALTTASGAEFERLWLEGMIQHHEGALAMARTQQQHEFASGRRSYGVDVLVDDILIVQRSEITKMKTWLVQWGLERSATSP